MQARHSAGVPVGGQFRATARAAATVTLTDADTATVGVAEVEDRIDALRMDAASIDARRAEANSCLTAASFLAQLPHAVWANAAQVSAQQRGLDSWAVTLYNAERAVLTSRSVRGPLPPRWRAGVPLREQITQDPEAARRNLEHLDTERADVDAQLAECAAAHRIVRFAQAFPDVARLTVRIDLNHWSVTIAAAELHETAEAQRTHLEQAMLGWAMSQWSSPQAAIAAGASPGQVSELVIDPAQALSGWAATYGY